MSPLYGGIVDSLRDFFNGVTDGVRSALTYLWDKLLAAINVICQWVWDTIKVVGQIIWDFFFGEEKGLVWWMLGKLGDFADWFADQVPNLSNVLSYYSAPINTTMELVSKLDKFFPLTEAITLFGIFITFVLIFIAVKFILKLIPTIG